MFSQNTTRRATKTVASLVALIVLPLSLTACGGSDSLDGTYYYYDKDYEGEGSQLTIKGTNATFLDFDTEEPNCDFYDGDINAIDPANLDAEGMDAHGALNDEGTQIIWDPTFDDIQYIYDNEMEDDVSPVTSTTSGDDKIITIGGYAFTSKAPKGCPAS